jgi:UDP:flavonoid glycosyltransferase YjiC (YdhE family)
LAAPPEKMEWARQLGCPFHPFGDNITAFIDSMKDAHSIRSSFRFVGYLRKILISQFHSLPEIIAGADLVVGASLVGALSSVAESMGIRYRYVAFTPLLLRSSHYPFLIFKHQGFPAYYNRMTWRIARILDHLNLTSLVNKGRRQLKLRPVKDVWETMLGPHVIVASDKAVSEVPSDVVPSVTQTGYLHLDQGEADLEELERFLDAGSPPVYAGFGSMPKKDQDKNIPIIVKAARSAGRRVVIAKFWEEPSGFSSSDDVFFISKYPHLKLFPRMAGVIHHGGAGTVAASAISGVPQIVVPHILDQYYWGNQVYRSNLGPRPIWRSRLTSQKLATAIEECLSNTSIRERAAEVAKKIDRQKSLDMAAREVVKAKTED